MIDSMIEKGTARAAAREAERFVTILRGRNEAGDIESARVVAETVVDKALKVVGCAKDIATRVKYLEIAVDAAKTEGAGRETSIQGDLNVELVFVNRSQEEKRATANTAADKLRNLNPSSHQNPLEPPTTGSAARSALGSIAEKVVRAQQILGRTYDQGAVVEGVDRILLSYGGTACVYEHNVRLPLAEVMEEEELKRVVARVIAISREEGIGQTLQVELPAKVESITYAQVVFTEEKYPKNFDLIKFESRHNNYDHNFVIKINVRGYIAIIFEGKGILRDGSVITSEDNYRQYATLIDNVAVRLDKEINGSLERG